MLDTHWHDDVISREFNACVRQMKPSTGAIKKAAADHEEMRGLRFDVEFYRGGRSGNEAEIKVIVVQQYIAMEDLPEPLDCGCSDSCHRNISSN
jgi:hypothetical protein